MAHGTWALNHANMLDHLQHQWPEEFHMLHGLSAACIRPHTVRVCACARLPGCQAGSGLLQCPAQPYLDIPVNTAIPVDIVQGLQCAFHDGGNQDLIQTLCQVTREQGSTAQHSMKHSTTLLTAIQACTCCHSAVAMDQAASCFSVHSMSMEAAKRHSSNPSSQALHPDFTLKWPAALAC